MLSLIVGCAVKSLDTLYHHVLFIAHQLMCFVLEAVDSKHLEDTFCCTFPLDPSATWPACLSCTSPPVLSGFGQ